MKGPEAFRTISEAANELGVPQHVLRFWETKFSFIRPMKRAGGRRFYRKQDIDVLRGVRALLHDEGYTIKGVQRLHKEHGVRRLVEAASSPAEDPTSEGVYRPSPSPDVAPEEEAGLAAGLETTARIGRDALGEPGEPSAPARSAAASGAGKLASHGESPFGAPLERFSANGTVQKRPALDQQARDRLTLVLQDLELVKARIDGLLHAVE